MAFLPENYSDIAPSETGGRYTKFQKGETKIRPVSGVRIGWEWWDDNGKPHRVEGGKDKRPQNVPARINKFGNEDISFFWALKVYNYETQQIELCQIRQSSIRQSVQSLVSDPEWGDPSDAQEGYGLKIVREDGDRVTYTVMPSKSRPIPDEILQLMEVEPIDISAWFNGGNPFEASRPAVEEEIAF